MLSVTAVQSQPNYRHKIVSIGMGPSFTGSGDDIGTGMFNECLLSLNDWVSINSRLFFYMFNNAPFSYYNVIEYYSQQTGLSMDLGLNLSPFRTGKRYLYMMGGGCFRYFANCSAYADFLGYYTQADNVTNHYAVEYRDYGYNKGISPGWYFGLGFTENISTHLTYGLKCNFQLYFDEGSMSDVIWLMGINIGYDFH
jgi:hypothetical protein